MPFPLALGAALLPAAFQGIKGIFQKNEASNLKFKDFDYMPDELKENRDLAKQQAYSRRAPGQANAENLALRAQANQISAAQRTGDANKQAAITAGATSQTTDALARLSAQGNQFSENAFGRLSNANSAIGQQKRQNYNEYWNRVGQLNQSGDQNIFNAVSNVATVGALGGFDGLFKGAGPEARAKFKEAKETGREIAKESGGKVGRAYVRLARADLRAARQAARSGGGLAAGGVGNLGNGQSNNGQSGFSSRYLNMISGYGFNPLLQQQQNMGVWNLPGGGGGQFNGQFTHPRMGYPRF